MSDLRDSILEHVDEYTPRQLADFIGRGVVTLQELISETDGKFTPSKRKEVRHLLDNGEQNDYEAAVSERTVDACQKYLNLYPTGEHFGEIQALLDELLSMQSVEEDLDFDRQDWELVDKGDIDSVKDYIRLHPDSRFVREANRLLNELLLEDITGVGIDTLVSEIHQIQAKKLTPEQKNNQTIDKIQDYISKNKISKDDFLAELASDHNLLNAGVVKQLVDDGTISVADLLEINIDKEFIRRMMRHEGLTNFDTPEKLEQIAKQSTEVYFWGIPSSGKSCALGAILSVANSGRIAKSMDKYTESQGYGYMNRLINLFQSGEIGSLMTGTSVDAFYEMGFDLVDEEDKIHPITCIDMAGELMRCMYKANAGEDMSDLDREMLDTMTKVLVDNKSVNRKIHIFVIEYGAEDRLYEGLPQRVYLDGAMSYIKSTGLFRRDTDAIYIMISKADKLKKATPEKINAYIEENYLGFYNGLERICKDNEINRGRVEKIAFSLGEVCFQNYCKFNSRPAENVVRLLLQRSASYKGGKIGKIGGIFRS